MRQRPALAPAGHAAVDERGIARQAHVGPQAQALHHAGAKAFDEHVGALDEGQRTIARVRLAQVQRQHLPPARQHVVGRGLLALAADAQHLGAQVGQHHRAEGAGADALHLDDLQSVQRPWHGVFP
jgi:hypothetical protein